MSLFKKVHRVKVPAEYLDKGEAPIELRFSQLNARQDGEGKPEGYPEGDRVAERRSWRKLSEEQRKASLDRQRDKGRFLSQVKRASRKKPRHPTTFDDFDQHTLVTLAHVDAPGRVQVD